MMQLLNNLRHSRIRLLSITCCILVFLYILSPTVFTPVATEDPVALHEASIHPNSNITGLEKVKSKPESALDFTRVATMIEPRLTKTTIPVLINFLSLVPPSWPFVVWCSQENNHSLREAKSLRTYIDSGKLNITVLPAPYHFPNSLKRAEDLSRFLLGSWFWRQFHPSAEHLLFFQSDSILCSKSTGSLEDWLQYDFVGGPVTWAPTGRGANGGLSMRRISAMQRITQAFESRVKGLGKVPEFTWPEDWFAGRLTWAHYFTSEDVFFSDAISLEGESDSGSDARRLGRWAVDDARDQSEFSLDIWSPSKKKALPIPIGIHTGNNLGPYVVRIDNGTGLFTQASQILVDRCPEVLMLRFAIDVTDPEQSQLEIERHPE